MSIEHITRDNNDLERSSVRGTLYRGGKWRQVADLSLTSNGYTPNSRKLDASEYHLNGPNASRVERSSTSKFVPKTEEAPGHYLTNL